METGRMLASQFHYCSEPRGLSLAAWLDGPLPGKTVSIRAELSGCVEFRLPHALTGQVYGDHSLLRQIRPYYGGQLGCEEGQRVAQSDADRGAGIHEPSSATNRFRRVNLRSRLSRGCL